MPRRSPLKQRLPEIVAFVDQYLTQIEATERAAFRRLGLNPDDARGILYAKDISAAFDCVSSVSGRLLQNLLTTFPEKYERVQINEQRFGIAHKR